MRVLVWRVGVERDKNGSNEERFGGMKLRINVFGICVKERKNTLRMEKEI